MTPPSSLTEGSIPRTLLVFSLPILLGNVLRSINGSVNAVWVGKFLGEAALAAVGNSNAVMFLLFGVLFGMSMVLYGAVRSTGAVVPPLVMLTIALWGIRVPFAYGTVDRWRDDAIWWSFPVASTISMVMSAVYYRYGGWRNAHMGNLVPRPAPAAGS